MRLSSLTGFCRWWWKTHNLSVFVEMIAHKDKVTHRRADSQAHSNYHVSWHIAKFPSGFTHTLTSRRSPQRPKFFIATIYTLRPLLPQTPNLAEIYDILWSLHPHPKRWVPHNSNFCDYPDFFAKTVQSKATEFGKMTHRGHIINTCRRLHPLPAPPIREGPKSPKLVQN